MAPPFDFDLNELPPEDGAIDASPATAPAREPSPQDLPPPPAPVREPSPQDLPSPPARKPAEKDPPLPPSPVLDLEAPLSPLDEEGDDDADPQLPGPPPILPAAPEPCSSASVGATPSRSSGEGDTSDDTTRLPYPPSRRSPREDGEMAWPSSQETSAPRVPSSRGPSDTSSSQRSRHGPTPYVPRDDAISKRRRGGGGYGYDEDAASSYGGSSRSAGAPSPRRHDQMGGRLVPAMQDGLLGPRPRNRRRRRPQGPYMNQNPGHDQRMRQGHRGREQPQQGFRGQERPQSGHQGYHGPRGNAMPNFDMQQNSSSSSSSYYRPLPGPPSRDDAYHRRQNQTQGPPKAGGYHQRKASPFSGQHGREDAYHRQQNQVHEHPKTGGYQHRDDDAPPPFSGPHGRGNSYGRRQSPVQETRGYRQNRVAPAPVRSPIRSHGREDSYGGGRPNRAAQEPGPNANGGYQQREAPRRRSHVPVQPYHPYARDAGAFDGAGNQARHESRPNYQHRRDDTRNKTGGPVRGHHRPYGEVQK